MSNVKKILILDDDSVLRITLKQMLSQMGYDSIPTYSIEGALKLASTAMPDLILLDLDLGQESGHDFIKLHGKNMFLKTIPIIVISSSKERSDIISTNVKGAVDYILKPIDKNILEKKIAKHI